MQPWKARLSLLFCFFLGSCRSRPAEVAPTQPPVQAPQKESTPAPGISADPFALDLSDFEIFEAGLINEAKPILDQLTQNTVYLMDWTLSDELDRLEGVMLIRYTNQENLPLDTVILRLYPNISSGEMTVSDLEVNGAAVTGNLERSNNVLRIDLAQPIDPGAQIELAGSFAVQLPLEMSGNYGLFGSFDGLLVLQEAYPIVPVYDEDGWDIDLPAPHGDLTHLDMSYYVVRVSLPADLSLIATGYTLDHKIQGERQSATFVAGPARDFYFAAGEFTKTADQFDETIINSYVLPEGEASSERALIYGKAAIAIFNQRLVKYPYSEFDMLSTPMLALGIEYPGVTALNVNMYDPRAEISGTPGTYYLESVIAHEVAHQWFYNLVGNDQLDHPWLDEALAQYLTGIYFLDAYGEGAYQEFRQSWVERWERVDQEPTPISLPAADYEGRAYGAIVYGRGPLFVEALAQEMGEDAFWEFLRSFTQRYAWDIAQPADFTSLAEATCACDLGTLWETWGISP